MKSTSNYRSCSLHGSLGQYVNKGTGYGVELGFVSLCLAPAGVTRDKLILILPVAVRAKALKEINLSPLILRFHSERSPYISRSFFGHGEKPCCYISLDVME